MSAESERSSTPYYPESVVITLRENPKQVAKITRRFIDTFSGNIPDIQAHRLPEEPKRGFAYETARDLYQSTAGQERFDAIVALGNVITDLSKGPDIIAHAINLANEMDLAQLEAHVNHVTNAENDVKNDDRVKEAINRFHSGREVYKNARERTIADIYYI